jgi:CheY-like chemotaxis protein
VADYIPMPFELARIAAALSWLPALTPTASYILVVADDRTITDPLLRALEGTGWRAVVARTGREALTAITARQPVVIVLDLLLPDMDGVQLIATLCERPGRVECPITIIASHDLSSAERAQLQSSARQLLRKGVLTLEELTRQMHCCLTTHSRVT